jgi:dienelactone hydrolase
MRQRQPRGNRYLAIVASALLGLLGCEASAVARDGSRESARPCVPGHASIEPALTGPYCVGMQRFVLTDSARDEPFTRDPADSRQVALTLHYPIEPGSDAQPAPYGDVATWGVTFGEARPVRAKSSAVLDEAIANTGTGFPLVLYSPGFALGLSDTNTFMIHALVSHGYVVAAVDHPYVSLAVRLDGDRIARFDDDLHPVAMPDDVVGDDDVYAFPTVVDDLAFVLDHVLDLAREDEAWRGRIDATRVGAFGHSYGGAAAAELLRRDERVSAAIDYDGRFHPDAVEHGIGGPLLLVAIEGRVTADSPPNGNYDYRNALRTARPGDYAEIAGAIHGTFQADIGVLLERKNGKPDVEASGTIDPETALAIFQALNFAFFDAELGDGSEAELRAVARAHPEVRVGVAE